MFLSGADQKEAEFRLPSFKGALRFWWRTLAWKEVQDRNKLHEKEGELFGSSKHGQSKVWIRCCDLELEPQVHIGQIFEKGRLPGAHYLGYGVMEAFPSKNKGTQAGQLTRPMIPGGTFTVELGFHPQLEEPSVAEVRCALVLLGTIGGLGSKSRKGFGSLTLTDLVDNDERSELEPDPEKRLQEVLKGLPEGEPDWTAWSRESRVIKIKSKGKSAVELLDELGREQVYYRSWGHNGNVLDRDSERNFEEDHHLFKNYKTEITYPRRVAFGLPHNYGKGDKKEVKRACLNHDRRASPLFLHIHHDLNNPDTPDPVGLAAFLPARFLPEKNLRVFEKEVEWQEANFWSPVEGYLDRLIAAEGATKKKTNLEAREVALNV